jgi:hypothetical protein
VTKKSSIKQPFQSETFFQAVQPTNQGYIGKKVAKPYRQGKYATLAFVSCSKITS